jgi:sporulation protein YlmC with PRC-barrel domain
MIEDLLNEFYSEFGDIYIDINTHQVLKLLIEAMQEENILPEEKIDWDELETNC